MGWAGLAGTGNQLQGVSESTAALEKKRGRREGKGDKLVFILSLFHVCLCRFSGRKQGSTNWHKEMMAILEV
jgi:hypothetical protein